jgi:excinuclease ABC subunit B
VSLVAILDADKEGFLRSDKSLIQTIGRAARNVSGQVVMYADRITDSMRVAINETERRRAIQEAYNQAHGITPQSIIKQIDDVMSSVYERDYLTPAASADGTERFHSQAQLDAFLAARQQEMRAAAANLDFEKAAAIRDEIKRLRNPDLGLPRTVRGA